MVKIYKKKPIKVDAEQWFYAEYDRKAGVNTPPIYHLDVNYFRHPDISEQGTCKHCDRVMLDLGWIDTLEGGHIVCPNDWIITGVAGEKYPCKPVIFEATYEEVIDE